MSAEEANTRNARVVPDGEIPCVWMLGGVLAYWICDRALDCDNCPLDAALRHDTGRLQERVRRETPDARRARIPPPGPAPGKTPPGTPPPGEQLADLVGSDLPRLDPRSRFERTHTWVRDEGPAGVRMGVDPFVARIAGRLRCLVLAAVGTRLRRGQPCAWLDQPGGTLTVLSPLTGVVRARNEAFSRRSEFELRDPQGKEWLLLLRPLRLVTESRGLEPPESFAAIVEEDFRSWQRRLAEALGEGAAGLGPTAADGGVRVRDLGELLGELRLHRLAAPYLGGPRFRHGDREARGLARGSRGR
jgi:glycine cleavage system H lipoate-binding protein